MRGRALALLAVMLLAPALPLALADEAIDTEGTVRTSADLPTLQRIGIEPSTSSIHGWSEDGRGEALLRYRDATYVPVEAWAEVDGNEVLEGWAVLAHTYPVPTDWTGTLESAGMTCGSYIPPQGIRCEVPGIMVSELADLGVIGIMRMDETDKVESKLATAFDQGPMDGMVGFGEEELLIMVLKSAELEPEGIEVRLEYYESWGRYGMGVASQEDVGWLARQGGIEWIQPYWEPRILNGAADDIVNVTWTRSASNMNGMQSGWGDLTGAGVTVTVADTGLDNGVNNTNMHPDLRDHIASIDSMAMSVAARSVCGVAWNEDGAADDDSGHGTHVAGTVLGDGTDDSAYTGMAPDARLHFQALEVECTQADSEGNFFRLLGIPSDYDDLWSGAESQGSRVHTNSWGGGSMDYDVTARMIDEGGVNYPNMTLLFAAGNAGVDANSNGEVDDESLTNQGQSKNALVIGASETNIDLFTNTWGTTKYSAPISTDTRDENPEGMAAFSSRGPTTDDRIKPDMSAPGTFIASTRSRVASGTGWGAIDADYLYMGGTSMATPVTAGVTALLYQHLDDNLGYDNASSALVRGLLAASAYDMAGQYTTGGVGANGAATIAPNGHEGWGRVDLRRALDSSFVDDISLSTGDNATYRFTVPSGLADLTVMLSWTDPAASTSASVYLVNDLDLALKDPSGTWTEITDDRNTLVGTTLVAPTGGVWEVHVNATNVPTGPQAASIILDRNLTLIDAITDADLDGTIDSVDACPNTLGFSIHDRRGCPDTDGDGYSNPSGTWTTVDGADAFPSVPTQWADGDGDGYGDNPAGVQPDACTGTLGNSTLDRFGCEDTDGDGYSNPGGSWTTAQGADACVSVWGNSTRDRYGCHDTDGDGASDTTALPYYTVDDGADRWPLDPTQWADGDSDNYGDNPTGTTPDACPSVQGTSTVDRYGCLDTDTDGYSDPTVGWTAASNGADAFPNDDSQWVDSDGDGFGDNAMGTQGDACPSSNGNSTIDRFGCIDTDGDGRSNPGGTWTVADGADAVPNNPTQHLDGDGDGYGDDPSGTFADDCPGQSGTSNQNGTYGCPDADNDGWQDSDDALPNDPSQWNDTDGDGFYDLPGGTNGDTCPDAPGNSTQGGVQGCPDQDGDGWADTIDEFVLDSTQHQDTDGDGYGDALAGTNGDACPTTFGNSTQDRYGCVDSDGDGVSDLNDAFPTDPTRSVDQDNDGVTDSEDACPTVTGFSVHDRLGCLDSDTDGYSDPSVGWLASDGADAFPADPSQWNDSDGDGFGDSPIGTEPDACTLTSGSSTSDRFGCPDGDGDGVSDEGDDLPNDPTQTTDSDGDGFGDNISGNQGDECPDRAGNSTRDRFGCVDSDRDGSSDPVGAWTVAMGADAWPSDPSQWSDTDSDGFGDNASGNFSDDCPNQAGSSHRGLTGCPDSDSDGWANSQDAFPSERSQYLDTDGDGYGDNTSLGAARIDHAPNDPNRNIADLRMDCSSSNTVANIGSRAQLACSITNMEAVPVTADLQWSVPVSVVPDLRVQILNLAANGNATVSMSATILRTNVASETLMTQISVRELGSTDPIRTHGFTIIAIDPSIEPEVVELDPASQDGAGAADGGVDALASVRAGLPPELQPMGVLEGLMAAVFLVGLLGVTLIRRGRAKRTRRQRRESITEELLAREVEDPEDMPILRSQLGLIGAR